MIDADIDVEFGKTGVDMIRPALAPLLDKMGSVPVADLRAKPVFAHLAHGEHDMRVRLRQPVGTDVPMDIEVGDHTAFDEFGLGKIARAIDALMLVRTEEPSGGKEVVSK